MPDAAPADVEVRWVAEQRKWARGWRRLVYPTIFLAYLIQVVTAIPHDSRGDAVSIGYAIVGLFALAYLFALPSSWIRASRRFAAFITLMSALCIAELPFAHADALVMGVFVGALAVVRYGEAGLFVPLGFTLVAVFLPEAVASWHDTIATGLDNGTAIAIPLAGFAMYGFGRVIEGNGALAEARATTARLAAENERIRIARDLHDLLGHSLTTIAVKSDLAQRLGATDPRGAMREIEEVAALSRRALGDVRAAVANYRDVTLASELATGRELLRAAGIAAELPPAADIADDATQELFGWVVREGLTNVVRHSHARHCRVEISLRAVEIVDDGVGGARGCGNGLAGLAERVAAFGGVIEAGPADPAGWRLTVRVDAAIGS